MFVTKNLIRLHDIDMAGILYFPRQFRFVHEALEDFMESEGFSFKKIFNNGEFLFVIVHCESDYLVPLRLRDHLEIHVYVEDIGTTSFTLCYNIYQPSGLEVGKAKTVHVTINKKTMKKCSIPNVLRKVLEKHLATPPAKRP